MILRKKKGFLKKFDTNTLVPPLLNVQIWDKDSLSPDDFLGTLSLNLSKCPIPSKNHKNCPLKNEFEILNVFNVRRIKGWFPVYGNDDSLEDRAIVQTVRLYCILCNKKLQF